MTRNNAVTAISLVAVMFVFFSVSCTRFSGNGYSSEWERYPDSRWVGPNLWANRLADWEIRDGRLTCLSDLPLRTVHLMTRRTGPEEGNLITMVNIRKEAGILTGDGSNAGGSLSINNREAAAGVLLGAGSHLDYLSSSLIFHSWGEGAGLFIGLDAGGKVFVRDLSYPDEYPAYAEEGFSEWKEALLRITAETAGEGMSSLNIIAVDPSSRHVISAIEDFQIEPAKLTGNVALVSHSEKRGLSATRFSFAGWRVRGSRMLSYRERSTGPLVTAQYTLSRSILKMTAQLMTVGKELCDSVDLQFMDENRWQTVATSAVDTPSYTASYRLTGITGSEDRPYRLIARYRYGHDAGNMLYGIVKHDPIEKEEIKLLSLSCIEQVIKPDPKVWAGIDAGYFPFEWGILFPHRRMTDNLKRHKPDLLFFAGDQVYESASPTAAVFGEGAIEDYLYKWYLWCITYRDLTTTVPAITIPDDHDVYHGNLWGCGGRATPPGLEGSMAQDAGGYKMSPRFVNMVQKTQTSHLPDPVDPEPAEQGIGVYFTECNIGGVSLAVIEDRKFKSAPAELLPDAMIVNGWPQNPRWSAERYADVREATLLGDRQYAFLERWAGDWSGGAWMKAVLSQTVWANLATLPDSATSDAIVPFLEIPDSGVYVTGDRIVTDFDSDGWPQSGRDRALKIIRKAFALHICGDQHLPSTLHYGTDEWGDAGYAIVSPATGNIFPRRWFPPQPGRNREDGSPEYTGEFRAIIFRSSSREIELANWPGYAGPATGEPFPGGPVTISQADNYGRKIIGWLPEVVTEGLWNPVVRIISESTGETVYSLRISGNSFQPGVFRYGSYTIEAGDPDTDIWRKAEGIQAWSSRERQKLVFSF